MPMQNVVPPPVQPPPRLHTQSPIMAMPQHHIIPGMPQTVFNVAPHYVVSATPVSLPMAPPFTPAASVTQAPRFRKGIYILTFAPYYFNNRRSYNPHTHAVLF